MAKLAKPFQYRGKWRACITLKNGMRPTQDFDKYDEAANWLAEQRANANSIHEPELKGPTVATLADALSLYAELYTLNKGGRDAELNRINHYLESAGKARLKAVSTVKGGYELKECARRALPAAWEQHNETRREARSQTYICIAELAKKRCSTISTADMRRLVTAMKSEGLSDSTIQKEVALLRHMFNMAAKEWNWKGFDNPCAGIKLGKSNERFVRVTAAERQRLWDALAECDNPFFYPLVEIKMQTTLRRSSLLAMRWDQVDLEGRVAAQPSKTGQVFIPLTQHAVKVLQEMPRDGSGRVFPMTANAVDQAWKGVRIKAALPKLQFRDLRHVGATDFVRRGFNSHQLKVVLGHKTTYMADRYVNLVNQDILDKMDSTAPASPAMPLPAPATGTAADMLNRKRAERVIRAKRAQAQSAMESADVDADESEQRQQA